MSRLRWTLSFFLLGVGIVTGILADGALTQRIPENPYRTLDKTGEPTPAAAVVSAVAGGDARALAKLLDQDVLKQLGSALEPLVEVQETQFVGAVEKSGDVLSAYLARGKEPRGSKIVRGFVLRVQADKVVGVN